MKVETVGYEWWDSDQGRYRYESALLGQRQALVRRADVIAVLRERGYHAAADELEADA